MPAWPGGPCPQCGVDMPANVVHCRECRFLLNPELERDSVEIPAFMPLQEIAAIIDVRADGRFVECPACRRELKIARKYDGQQVQCKFCRTPFHFDAGNQQFFKSDVYSSCPHCEQPLRFHPKYVGLKVACRFCNGKLSILPEA